MAYTDIDDSSEYFGTVLYTGNETARAITFGGNSDLDVDWIWLKSRSATGNHHVYDTVRGTQKHLRTNLTNVEGTNGGTDGVTAFSSNGFTVGANTGSNADGVTFVGWDWKAGTSFSNDASSTSVGSIDSAGSVSTDAGFSIITYTGTGSNGTIAHGLGVKPNIIINKTRDTTAQMWSFYHSSLGATKHLGLDRVNAVDTGAAYYQDTEPTSTVFSVGSESATNHNGAAMIAYCFADVQGYSKFGKFIGNGNADGPYIHLGFAPAFIIYKHTTDGHSWIMEDVKRNIAGNGYLNGPASREFYPDATNAEATPGPRFDFLSNGFKIRETSADINESGSTFIYMAFAENPFVTSTGVPGTAR